MAFLYNPELMREDEIRATFVARDGLVQDLLGLIKHQPETAGVQHAVIIGPRGMGKTTILLMLRLSLIDQGLNKHWQCIKFPEESYGVDDLADIWIETLDLLAQQTSDPLLTQTVERLRSTDTDSDELGETALATIKDWSTNHNKRLLLLIDNIDMILGQINDERQNARLREILMNDGAIMIVGTGISFFEEARAYDQPLYNFFRIFDLKSFTFDQVKELLRKRAAIDKIENFEQSLNDGKLRALEYFTGGNPRLILILYHVITGSAIEEIRRGLEKLLDEITPYYKAKTEMLPPQQRKILDCIARTSAQSREGITPTNIATATRMKVNQASAQLKRLMEMGYVRAANLRERSSYYTLSEPLYAIWYQMRFGQEIKKHMAWLVNFLKIYYSISEISVELNRLQVKFSECIGSGRLDMAKNTLEHGRYLFDALEDKTMRLKEAGELLKKHIAIGDFEHAKEFIDEADLEQVPEEALKKLEAEKLIDPMKIQFKFGIKAVKEGRFNEALPYFSKATELVPHSSTAWYYRGYALAELGKLDEAITSYDKSIHVKPNKHKAWFNRGNILVRLGRFEEAISSFDKAVQIKPDKHEAWYNRGNALAELSRLEEAKCSFDKAIQIEPADYEAYVNRGIVLVKLGSKEEAITSFDKAIQIKPGEYKVWCFRGNILMDFEKYSEALASYEKAILIKPDEPHILCKMGIALANLKKYDDSIISFDKALQIKPEMNCVLKMRGSILEDLGRLDEAYATYERSKQIKPDSDTLKDITKILFKMVLRELSVMDINKASNFLQEAMKSRTVIGNDEWNKIALQHLLSGAFSDSSNLLLQLISGTVLSEELFPLTRALEFLQSRDRALIEKLSPEYRGIVQEIVDKYDKKDSQKEKSKQDSSREK
jgi:tetratricopeptide (TPR) repeat protein